MKQTILFIAFFIITSCGVTTKHAYTQKEFSKIIDSVKVNSITKQIDTVKVFKDRVVVDVVESVVEVPIDCDSLGNVKNVSYKTKSGKNVISTIIKDNKLKTYFKLDSVKNTYEKIYKSRYKQDSIQIEQRLKEKYSKETTDVKVKKEWNPFKHLYCYIVIFLLLALNIVQFRRK